MNAGVGPAVVERARDAASRGNWSESFDLFVAADDEDGLGPPDLALFADVAYAAGHLDETIDAIPSPQRARPSGWPCTCCSTPR